MFSRMSGGFILLPFAIFWIVIVGTFDVVTFGGALRAFQSLSYAPVPGRIISSTVEEGTDSDGDRCYTPKIVYEYSVAGVPFKNGRLSYGMAMGGSKGAHQTVSAYPEQSQVTVFYDPGNPSESTLNRGSNGMELFILMFLTPFNLIGLALVVALLHRPATGVGGILVEESPRELRVHLNPVHPFSHLLVTLGGTTFTGTFVVAFGQFAIPVVPLATATWAVILWVCARQYLKARNEQSQSKGDLVYLPRDKVLECWPLGAEARERIPFNQVSGLEICRKVTTDSDGDPSTEYILQLNLVDGQAYPLRKWHSESDANAFMNWLKARLPIAAATEEGWTRK